MSAESILGAVDYLTLWGVHGWACDRDQPDLPLRIEAIVSGVVVGATTADIPRPDLGALQNEGRGCGFVLQFDRDFDSRSKITVRAIGPNGEREIDGASWADIEGYVELLTPQTASGWAWLPRQPDMFVEIEAKINGRSVASTIASDMRSDLHIAGRGTGLYGFRLTFEEMWSSEEDVQVLATRGGIVTRLPVQKVLKPDDGGGDTFSRPEDTPSNLAPAIERNKTSFESAPAPPPKIATIAKSNERFSGNPLPEVRHRILREGQEIFAANVDRVVGDDRFAIISGWTIGGTEFDVFDEWGDPIASPNQTMWFERNDVVEDYPQNPEKVRGFLMVWDRRPCRHMKLSFNCGGHNSLDLQLSMPEVVDEEIFETVVRENTSRLGSVFVSLYGIPAVVRAVLSHLQGSAGTSAQVRGHLEQAKGVPHVGGLVAGWLVADPRVQIFLADRDGNAVSIRRATRWTRDDIVQAMSADFGAYALNGGLWQSWRHPFRVGDELKLLAVVGEVAVQVSSAQWAAAPFEPVSFSRWAFSIITPRDTFAERLKWHDGPILEQLLQIEVASRASVEPEISNYGVQNENPLCSIIIPLYRRFDFMLNQFLEFELDETIRTKTELIYVIDDPALVSGVHGESVRLYKNHGVPFKTIWAGKNFGFAGASNLGVSVSSAPNILLMNSDVIPTVSGWLDQMMEAMDAHPKIGILGARLYFPGGAIQHDGMAFRWEPDWNAYLNKHPGAGLDLPVTSLEPVECVAVTAALSLLRRKVYDRVGGLDETFLIGDFEDSDLCLKISELGLDVACLQSVEGLIHLERQSFSATGAANYRELVARFNAWKHQSRWGEHIRTLLNSLGQG